ncbi:hypothetical protein SS50377_23957 [Spironucleus salmonicida]|uniref:Uncharacterized protein n=1 Tax=Spironucleus salmonicida TaxID=348837 RepID=V6LUN7_9EUKA|nr:hypothetical protein SS50377_23950 [Spironucleus salmonicida]KAH0574021.1 hypothetical protein SS50377_23957 [Spironucleus salmonicida]|eukprot:EST42937.1 Hypothetical protein SS50377_17470 [Spironucleus salmonicida]
MYAETLRRMQEESDDFFRQAQLLRAKIAATRALVAQLQGKPAGDLYAKAPATPDASAQPQTFSGGEIAGQRCVENVAGDAADTGAAAPTGNAGQRRWAVCLALAVLGLAALSVLTK